MNNYFKQILYDLRHQRIVTITGMLGTAIAIFLIMAVFTISSIETVPVSPESIRPQLLTGKFINIASEGGGDSSGNMSYNTANELYSGLEGITNMAYVTDASSVDVSAGDGDCLSLQLMTTDENFWDIFDFKFIAGKPFDKATVDSRLKEVIVQRGTAINLFGTDDVVNREININHVPYVVRGVVDNTSPLLEKTYANIYTPYAPESEDDTWMDGYGGSTVVYMAKDPDVKYEDVKKQVISRYATLNAKLKKSDKKAVYHQAPYTIDIVHKWSNVDPDTTTERNKRYIIYAILLILPAINISSMTRSRLRRRISEIGVRRAYGATKWSIFTRFITENLILTIAGGIIGMILCIIFVVFFSNMFVSFGGIFGDGDIVNARPSINMLLNFKTFGIAMVFCLLLNLLSTGMPAWRASRVNPAEAISGKN